MGLTAIGITVSGIYYNQSFLRIMPLYVSIVIGLLQSRVNRFASLIGSVNSIVYGVVYLYYNLYGAAFSAWLFSCPIQLLTFIRWNKNKMGNSTKLRKMTPKQIALVSVGFCVALALMWALLPLLGAEYVFLDSVTTLLGILIYFLTMFAYIEYPFFMIINGILSTALYVTMLDESPETMPYLIFSIYSFICICFAFFEARNLYKAQQEQISA
jgi:nicotinamide riboside transporter PnuC